MQQILGPFSDRIYALLRIVAGFLFFCHGAQKLLFSDGPPPQMPGGLFYTAGIIEFFGGALIAFGLFTSWAAFLCSGLMAVAYFMAHQPQALLPLQNKGELAALYSWLFLFMAARGSGPWSLDALRRPGASR